MLELFDRNWAGGREGSLGWTEIVGECLIVWAMQGSPQCCPSVGFVVDSPLLKTNREEKRGSAGAWPVAAPMPKLDSF